MKLSQSFFNEYDIYITPSDIIEFMYCKRFTYFMKCLGIEQHEEKRFKVLMGREVHEKKGKQNLDYLRKKIGSCGKETNVNLASTEHYMRGKVDEVHTLSDGTMAPLDYKYALYDEKLYQTYRNQLIMYAIMIEETYKKDVKRGFLVYCREGNKLIQVDISEADKTETLSNIEEYKRVLNGYYPRATSQKSKCLDCCYKNICAG